MIRYIKYEVNKKLISFGFIDKNYCYEIRDMHNLEASFDTEKEVEDYISKFEKEHSLLIEDPFTKYIRSAYFVRKVEYIDVEDSFDVFNRVLSEDWIFVGEENIQNKINESMVTVEDEAFNIVSY